MDNEKCLVENKIKEIVDFMVKSGTEKTSSSNYLFYGCDLIEIFKVDDQFLDENQDSIIDELWGREEVLDVVYDECFDIIFGTIYCPGLEEEY